MKNKKHENSSLVIPTDRDCRPQLFLKIAALKISKAAKKVCCEFYKILQYTKFLVH